MTADNSTVSRVLSGIQPTADSYHLGNYLGALKQWIDLQDGYDAFYFIPDLHAITVEQNPEELRNRTIAGAAQLIALGIDPDKSTLFVQSHVPAHTELTWVFQCLTGFGEASRMTQFKDKSAKQGQDRTSVGLFTYPVLMAADILLFGAVKIPVGKDQKQHLEMARDIASSFNHQYGDTFVLPDAKIDENIMTIPGTDGQKMSKSYGNTIDIFQTDKKLRKNVMQIVTDSKPLEEPKDPDTCNVFAIYKILGSDTQIAEMRNNYEGGNYGYGHAKQALYELIVENFSDVREKYDFYINNIPELESKLQAGELRAAEIANSVLNRVRSKIGY